VAAQDISIQNSSTTSGLQVAYVLLGVRRHTGHYFQLQTVPLAAHCVTYVFDSLSRIPDCGVISVVHFFSAFSD